MWDKIRIWTEENNTRCAKNIMEALENGLTGKYIVCDSENRVWGFGNSVRLACIDTVKPVCSEHSSNEEIAGEFYEEDFEVWSLLPAEKEVIEELSKKKRNGLDELLVIKQNEKGVAVL